MINIWPISQDISSKVYLYVWNLGTQNAHLSGQSLSKSAGMINRCRVLSGTRSSRSYSHENCPFWDNTSDSSSHRAKMWGVNHGNAMPCSISEWNAIFFDGSILCRVILSKKVVFLDSNFHQTLPARANCCYWSSPPPKNIIPYSICFASIVKTKEASFNKTIQIISHNVYTVAMDTTPKPL